MAEYYLGEIRMWAGPRIPAGWRLCDGSLLDVATYQALYTLIGTTYGSTSANNFALPDLRGRLAVGQGQGPGLTPHNLGAAGGRENVVLTTAQIPGHTHTIYATSTAGTANIPGPAAVWAHCETPKPYSTVTAAAPPDAAMSVAALTSDGGNQPHNNVMPSLVINFIIAVQGGLYPTPA
ncbi:MAG TPA: tail fiber protein [Methylomusa anaerophila]|uniref:Phage Tail Collar Domain protein n=1 Tax=Methylomusa anaerophila TaxID=1930071 RepID=A0A348AH29_9FIRM|nr:tail fiber protein [Methylomusa anaerophila]BBB90377.1 phage Tail Collar Domain protein [Methylomusa anaerophila]HML89276.1 tail fiber protein [Methylomusa anaerophila]